MGVSHDAARNRSCLMIKWRDCGMEISLEALYTYAHDYKQLHHSWESAAWPRSFESCTFRV